MLVQGAAWPGVAAVESCEGSIEHGITPATFVLTTVPQVARPEPFGSLVLTDGRNTISLRGCRASISTGRVDGRGQTFILEILDRRWRWQLGAVDGRFNRVDAHGKLIPWTIRSPRELAETCLQAMGETRYKIDLPDGLSRRDGADLDRYLRVGENFQQSLANPPVVWDRSNPAEVLARLCEYFARRVIYQPVADRVLIAVLGEGLDLPDGPSEMIVPSIKIPAMPRAIGVAGSLRIQARFALEAVGREWDDSFLPINDLSYAPRADPAPQITKLTYTGPETTSSLSLTFRWTPLRGGEEKTVGAAATGGTTIAAQWAALEADIASKPALAVLIKRSYAGNDATFTSRVDGQAFSVSVATVGGGGLHYKIALVQAARTGGGNWSTCPPPSFSSVLATERLSRLEAMQRAQQSVFKCYRIKAVDPNTGQAPLVLPWYGRVKRRQQVTLLPSRVAQVVPQARVAGGTDRGALLPPGELSAGILPEFYNGYSRDQQAVIYGSVSRFVGAVSWVPAAIGGGDPFNTAASSRVYVDFSIDPVEQVITFGDYVYAADFAGGGWVRAANLVLETGCLVSAVEDDQIVRWWWRRELGGTAPEAWRVHEDAEVGIIGSYSDSHRLMGYEAINKADADARAAYYLDAMTIPLQVAAGVTRQYPGILPIDPDGKRQQVTWQIGGGGPTTVASTNTEHSPNRPPYPVRRLRENLPANQAAAAANLAERAQSQKLFPRPGGAVS